MDKEIKPRVGQN